MGRDLDGEYCSHLDLISSVLVYVRMSSGGVEGGLSILEKVRGELTDGRDVCSWKSIDFCFHVGYHGSRWNEEG